MISILVAIDFLWRSCRGYFLAKMGCNWGEVMAKFAALLVVFSSFVWATGGPIIKILLRYGLTENEIFLIKAIFCTVSILLFDILFRKKVEKIRNVKDFLGLLVCGVIGYLYYGMFYGYAVKRIPMSVAVILVYTAPAIVMLISVLVFRERFTIRKRICLAMILAGCIFVTGILTEGVGDISAIGVLWGLASGGCFALYSVFGSVMMKKYDPWTVTTYNFIFALVAVSFMTDIPQAVEKVLHSKEILMYGLYFAIFCGTISNLVYMKALEYIEASKASMITTIEPVATCVIGVVWFQETISWMKLVGIALILTAVLLLNMGKEKLCCEK